MRHRGGMSLRCRSDVAFLHCSDLAGRLGGDIALRRRSDIAKRNHLGHEGGRSDVAVTFVKVDIDVDIDVAATSPGDLEATSHCDVAATSRSATIWVAREVAATSPRLLLKSLRPPCDLKFLLGSINSDQHKSVFVDQRL